jgi:hypothetical protein
MKQEVQEVVHNDGVMGVLNDGGIALEEGKYASASTR